MVMKRFRFLIILLGVLLGVVCIKQSVAREAKQPTDWKKEVRIYTFFMGN